MKKFFELFHKELSGMHEAAFFLGFTTLVSSLLGLLRVRLVAAEFGAGELHDIYVASFALPDFLYAVAIFLVASTAIIPVLVQKLNNNEQEARQLINSLFTVFFVVILCVMLLIYVCAPTLVKIFLPGFSGESLDKVILLTRIMLFQPFLLGLSNLVSSVTQTYRRFLIYALSPVFYNLGIISGILLFYPMFGLPGLAYGVALGALLHFAIQVPSLIRLGFTPKFTTKLSPDIFHIFKLSLPRSFGLATTQFIVLAFYTLASRLSAGSIAIYDVADSLQALPLVVVGLSYSVAAFPTMAELILKKEKHVFFDHLTAATRHIVFWTLPMSVLFIVLRAQIVRALYGAGAFDWNATRLAAASVALFALGIVAQSLITLFVRAYYALGKVWLPILINLFSALLTISLAFIFVYFLQHSSMFTTMIGELLRVSDLQNIAMLGLPLAFSLGALCNVFLLSLGFGWVEDEFKGRGITVSLGEIGIASLILGGVSYVGLFIFSYIAQHFLGIELNTFIAIFLQGLFAGLLGIAAFYIFLKNRNNQELLDIESSITDKFWKQETIVPEPERL
jgi:putative peptidoglycan lipid II flippase